MNEIARIEIDDMIDIQPELDLMTGMIVSTKFLKRMYSILDLSLLKIIYVKTLCRWCIRYFIKYEKSPKSSIQKIYQNEKDNLDEAEAELIKEFLSKISDDYVVRKKDFDMDYEFENARRYLQQNLLLQKSQTIMNLVNANQLDSAIELAKNQSGLEDIEYNISEMVKTSTENVNDLINRTVPHPFPIILPWLTSESLSMICAPKGVGKTWFCLKLATIITREKYLDINVHPWRVKHSTGVLYIDGEMGEWNLQSRLKMMINRYGKNYEKSPLIILSSSTLSRGFGRQINLCQSVWRTALYDFLSKNSDRIRVVFFDNIAALTEGINENDSQDWDPINQWLLSLRHLGLAVVLVHHTRKDGKSQRGTSSREDALDNIIHLSLPDDYEPGQGARFNVRFEKARNTRPGTNLNSFIEDISDTLLGED